MTDKFEFFSQGQSVEKIDRMSEEELLNSFEEHAFNKVEEHFACWDLSQRGTVGETPLHVCLLNDSEAHLAVAKIMLSFYPKLSLDYYEGEEYYGKCAKTNRVSGLYGCAVGSQYGLFCAFMCAHARNISEPLFD